MSDCDTCGGDGRIPLLGPNYTTCPDCEDNDESFSIFSWTTAVWLANSYCRVTLLGTEKGPTLSFGPKGGIAIKVEKEKWVASTTNGKASGGCTDMEKLANQLRGDDHFWFQEQHSFA